ncbi:MAG: hypothetical protein GY856_08530 [bacterium]|nr:hypothetical protein [bacterium]
MLLVGGGLMFRSIQKLRQIDPGFETDQMLVLRITPSQIRYPEHRDRAAYLEQILTRIRGIPGVVSAGCNSLYPHRTMVILVPMLPEGRSAGDPDATIPTNIRSISPDLIETMKMRLLSGRTFNEQDRAGNELVMIVSKALARSAWPGEDPLDRQIRYALPGYQFPWMRVVGVVEDVLDNGEIEATAYVAYNQFDTPAEFMDIVVRTDPAPMSLLPQVREAIWSINSEQAVADVVTADALMAGEFWEERSSAFLMGMFATVGLLLTIVGLYGIQSYSVLQQRHEMGVRMVFGARPRDVVLAALGHGMLLAGIGVFGTDLGRLGDPLSHHHAPRGEPVGPGDLHRHRGHHPGGGVGRQLPARPPGHARGSGRRPQVPVTRDGWQGQTTPLPPIDRGIPKSGSRA